MEVPWTICSDRVDRGVSARSLSRSLRRLVQGRPIQSHTQARLRFVFDGLVGRRRKVSWLRSYMWTLTFKSLTAGSLTISQHSSLCCVENSASQRLRNKQRLTHVQADYRICSLSQWVTECDSFTESFLSPRTQWKASLPRIWTHGPKHRIHGWGASM